VNSSCCLSCSDPCHTKMPKSGSRSSSKKAQKSGSNVFDMFTQKQVSEMKEGFQIMDHDKDGILGKDDLRCIFDEIGRIISDQEINDMLGEADGPLNFTMFLNMFGEKNKGEVDDDELIKQAFQAYVQEDGMIDGDVFRHAIMTWGDQFTKEEVDDAYNHIPIDDDNMIDGEELISMLCAGTGKDSAEDAAA